MSHVESAVAVLRGAPLALANGRADAPIVYDGGRGPDERAAAAGILSVSRNAGAALAPLLTGAILATPSLGLPFLLAGGLKVVYDLWIFAVFRHVKPPEEEPSI